MSILGEAFIRLLAAIVWHPTIRGRQLHEFDRLTYEIKALIEQRERMALACVVTLDRIASWDEGEQVDRSFDEPHAAQLARQQLAAFGITGPLNQEHGDGQAEAGFRGDGQGRKA